MQKLFCIRIFYEENVLLEFEMKFWCLEADFLKEFKCLRIKQSSNKYLRIYGGTFGISLL